MGVNILEVRLYTKNPKSSLLARADVDIGDFVLHDVYVKKPAKSEHQVNWPQLRSPERPRSVLCKNSELEAEIKNAVLKAYWAVIEKQTANTPEIDIPFG